MSRCLRPCTTNDVQVFALWLFILFMFGRWAGSEWDWAATPPQHRPTCHCQWEPNIFEPIHFGCLREGELECPSLSVSVHPSVCLSVSLDSSAAVQSDQTPYHWVLGVIRLQQPQLHRKCWCGCCVKLSVFRLNEGWWWMLYISCLVTWESVNRK